MKFAKLLLSVCATALYLILIATTASAQTVDEKTGTAFNSPTANSINGAWQLNPNESDDVLQKIQSLLAAASSTPEADAEQTALPGLSVSLFASETVFVHIGDQGETTVNESFADVVQTRTFFSDNLTRTFEVQQGASFSVMASQKDNRLTIETTSPRGNRLRETYEQMSNDKLSVTICIQSPAAQELISLHRVYDRLNVEIPITEEIF